MNKHKEVKGQVTVRPKKAGEKRAGNQWRPNRIGRGSLGLTSTHVGTMVKISKSI